MSLNSNTQKLKALPVQLIEVHGGVVLKRGCTEVKIGGEGMTDVIRMLLDAASWEGATAQEICERFAASDRPAIERLIRELQARNILVSGEDGDVTETAESNLDIFHWHFGEKTDRVTERLNSRHMVIVGVNYVSRQLAISLNASGVENFQVLDHPLLRNLNLFNDAGVLKNDAWPTFLKRPGRYGNGIPSSSYDCLVAVSDFGRSPELRELNKLCIAQGRRFLPVVLQNAIGYIGPFSVPGESACYECLLARRNSNLEDWPSHLAVEKMSFEGQGVAGFHPSISVIVGEITAFELSRAYGGALAPRVGTLIEVNLLATRLMTHKVLKVPRCPACSTLNTRPSTTLRRSMFNVGEPIDK
jgi:bacteriocin biosynthesis cyclodehydratase domain-containing protein